MDTRRPSFAPALALLIVCALSAPPANAGVPRDREREELIVRVQPGISDAEADAMFASQGGATVEEIPQIRAHVIRVAPAAIERVRLALSHRHEVESVERNLRVAPVLTPNDPQFTYEWHLARINAPAAWDVTIGSTSDPIAIIDSGVDPTHPDLAAKLLPGWNFYDNNADSSDVYGHGTEVAGAAAAISNNGLAVASLAWKNPILPVRVADAAGYAYFSTIAQGLTWAVDHGARIMNVSFLDVASSATIRSAAQYVHDHRGLVVAAAGNCGCDDATPETPYLLSVAATDTNDQRAGFSSRGSYVDLSAPGTAIWTTSIGGGYTVAAGTSFSSPITAGVAALMWAVNPALSSDDVVMLLEQTAVDLGPAGYDTSFGFGRIDANAAVRAASTFQTPPPDSTPPSVSITSPASGATVSGSVTIQTAAFDNVGVTSVQFRRDGVVIATDTAAPFSYAWDTKTATNGTHRLEAQAFDAAGNSSLPSALTVTVSNVTKTKGKGR